MLNTLKKTALVALGAMALLPAALPAMAGVPNYFRDRDNNIYIANQLANSRLQVSYQGVETTRDYQADAYGRIVLRNSTTAPITGTINVGGTPVNTATLPTQLLPRCINGTSEEARTANFKTSTGDVIIVGRGPSSYVTVGVNRDRIRAVAANVCGFARVGTSTAFQHTAQTSVRLPGETADRTIASLTSYGAPICNNGTLYVPSSWLGS